MVPYGFMSLPFQLRTLGMGLELNFRVLRRSRPWVFAGIGYFNSLSVSRSLLIDSKNFKKSLKLEPLDLRFLNPNIAPRLCQSGRGISGQGSLPAHLYESRSFN